MMVRLPADCCGAKGGEWWREGKQLAPHTVDLAPKQFHSKDLVLAPHFTDIVPNIQ